MSKAVTPKTNSKSGGGVASRDVSLGAVGPWEPWVHYIPIKPDLSDLVEKVRVLPVGWEGSMCTCVTCIYSL
jgi:hypothetical protein